MARKKKKQDENQSQLECIWVVLSAIHHTAGLDWMDWTCEDSQQMFALA